jgi:hypothetical protein
MNRILAVACLMLGSSMTLDGQQSENGAIPKLAAPASTRSAIPERCDYDRCALRFTLGFGSWSVVQGIDSRRVGRLGMFRGPDVANLVATVPEAAEEARRFQQGYARSSAFLWGGAALAVIGSGLAAGNDGHPLAVGLSVSGVVLMTYGAWSHGRSFNQLSRALWLYNRSLSR